MTAWVPSVATRKCQITLVGKPFGISSSAGISSCPIATSTMKAATAASTPFQAPSRRTKSRPSRSAASAAATEIASITK